MTLHDPIARSGASRGRWRLVVALVALQTLLLMLTSSPLAGGGWLYGCGVLCGTPAMRYVGLIAALFGIVMFVLPPLIGMLCTRWQAALAFSLLPWWAAVIAHAGTLLAPSIGFGPFGLSGLSGPAGGRFDAPFWLEPNRAAALLLSCLIFAVLGWFGWLLRQAFAHGV